MLSEAEAKAKWCPFAMTAGRISWRVPSATAGMYEDRETVASHNRGTTMGGALDSCRCLASGCAIWQDGGVRYGAELARIAAEPNSTRPEGDGWGYESVEAFNPAKGGFWVRHAIERVGRCGLAGGAHAA